MSLLDLIFPKYCINCRKLGSYLCPACFAYISFLETGTCVGCQRASIGGLTHSVCSKKAMIDGVFSSLVYSGVVKKLVYQFKYQPNLTNLQDLLTELFYEGLIQKENFYRMLTHDAVMVPIPLHSIRFKKRGYNQAKLLAEGLAKRFGLPVVECLERKRETKTQIGLSQVKRQENIKDAFALKRKYIEQISNCSQILLIDDVATSGATLNEAAKVLKSAGVGKVWGLTLAHGQ